MNNTEPEKYYQKAALAVKITRYIATFLFIVFVLSCIFIFRSDITVENIQYLMKYADFYDNTEVPDSAEISVNADSESHVFMLRDNLAVVSRSGIGPERNSSTIPLPTPIPAFQATAETFLYTTLRETKFQFSIHFPACILKNILTA